MINDILNYINFLENKFDLNISIHGCASCVTYTLTPHNIHTNPYCLFINADKERHMKCIEHQNELRTITDDIHLSTCMCGVSQYIVPINHTDEYLGFVCVSGYRNAKLDIKEYSTNFNIPTKTLQKKAQLFLCPQIPNKTFIKTIIKPLCTMLAILLKDTENPQNNCDYELYNHILSVIHGNVFEKKLTIDKIAKACFCSKSMVSHVFKKRSGISINNYITNLRMKKAEDLLKTSNLNITDVAYSCGYTDSNYFVYVFGKRHGISPLKYRKAIHNKHTYNSTN